MKTETKVNVAPSSTEGHFIKGARQVINLDNVNETFLVQGECELISKNHTKLLVKEDCVVTCQTVYDPFKEVFVKSKD